LRFLGQNFYGDGCIAGPDGLARMMNWTHVHLVLNHIPVIGFAVPIVLLLTAWVRKDRKLEWLSLQMFVVFALLTIPVYLTGSPASHHMREMPGISQEVIHRHSNASDFAFWTMEALGVFSLFTLYKFRSSAAVPPRASAALLALAVTTFGLMIWTANLGGKIRHPEIGAAIPPEQMRFVVGRNPSWPNAKISHRATS
jgi:hypothetical protein